MNNEYEKARIKHNSAFNTFDAIRKEYRARKIDESTFIQAREVYELETKIFDAAFEKAAQIDNL